uniref:Uncharacterized protein n=1 Tax=Chenopodium quinoa TaxID=63459 RepID=A0A803KMN0_CHEQI
MRKRRIGKCKGPNIHLQCDFEGEVLAKQFASLGAKLILSARNEAELERVKSQLSGKHAPNEVKILPLDLASGEESLKKTVEKAEAFFPGIGVDYMIHNAAYERPKAAAVDVTEESLKATFNVNVFGTISLTRFLAPYMLKRGRGHFVVMSSAAGKTPAPGQAVYCASKFALNGYFHNLRSELFQKGIKVTVVCPGPIETSTTVSTEKRLSAERCAKLTIIAASHGLKEVWISYQPVLGVMYLVQYMPTIGFWLMDKVCFFHFMSLASHAVFSLCGRLSSAMTKDGSRGRLTQPMARPMPINI